MRLFTLLLAWLLAASGAFAQGAGQPSRAGEVSFVAGRVLIGEGVQSRALRVGDTVQAGDVLQTGAGGHLHIKTIDGGFLALRPSSRARVDVFEFDPVQPAETRIRLVLENGVMRAVSGAGAQAARDKFRLNTPVAAIGIRGTDFTVFTSDSLTRVAVRQGEIALSPFDGDCRADALGPCAGAGVRALSADQVGRLLELRLGQGEARLVSVQPGSPLLAPGAQEPASPVAPATPPAPGAAPASPSGGGAGGPPAPPSPAAPVALPAAATTSPVPPAPAPQVVTPITVSAPSLPAPVPPPVAAAGAVSQQAATLVSEARIAVIVGSAEKKDPPAGSGGTTPPSDPPAVEPPPVVAPPVEVSPPPVVVVPPEVTPPPVAHWGRWSEIAGQPAAVSTAEFTAQHGAMVAINRLFVLSLSNPENLRLPETGAFSFALASAEAWTLDKGVVVGAASVLGGQLSVNFGLGTFATRLEVDALGTLATLSSQGLLSGDGRLQGGLIYSSPEVTMNVRGTLAGQGGKQAAYLFDAPLTTTRSVVGATRWGP